MASVLLGPDSMQDTITVPAIEFTRWLDVFKERTLNAISKPDPTTDPMSAYRYLRNRRTAIEGAARQRPMLRLFDKNMQPVAQIAGERLASVEEMASDSGAANVVLRYDNWLTDFILHQTKVHEDLHLVVDPNPSAPTWRTRWGGKVTGITAKRDISGIHTLELEAISNRQHAKNLLFGANPVFPPEIQIPKMWVLPGNTRTILSISMFINLARLFFPALSIPSNIFNPAGWINGGVTMFDPLNWPLQVAFCNPLLDQSRLAVLGATWSDWHSAMDDMLRDAGCTFRAYTWLTEDDESPHTELVDIVRGMGDLGKTVDELTRPKRNCVMFAVEDKSGVTGPTGTAADGVINVIGATLDDMITETLFKLDENQDGKTDPLFRKLLGVAPEKPKTIWYDGQFTGILEAERRQHKGPVKTVMTGSRSPNIVNQAQTFAIRWALSQLATSLNSFAPGAPTQIPGIEGMDNLYQGQLDNTLLAWMRFTDPKRALWSGDFAWQEVVERGSGTAYTLAGVVTLRVGNFKTRAWQGYTVKVINGRPHAIDIDVGLADRAGFEHGGVIFVDQITAIKRTWSRTEPVIVHLSIGDDTDPGDPLARGLRVVQAVWTTLSHFLGEGTIF